MGRTLDNLVRCNSTYTTKQRCYRHNESKFPLLSEYHAGRREQHEGTGLKYVSKPIIQSNQTLRCELHNWDHRNG